MDKYIILLTNPLIDLLHKNTLMKKLITLTLVACGFMSTQLKAQSAVGINLGMYKPSADGSDAQLGAQLSFKHSISDQIRIGANIGYYSKSSNEILGIKYSYSTMPITGLFEYAFSDGDLAPYAGADLGIYRFGSKISGGSGSSNSNIGFAPVAGANYTLSDNLALNVNFKYHVIFFDGGNTSAIGLNAGAIISF